MLSNGIKLDYKALESTFVNCDCNCNFSEKDCFQFEKVSRKFDSKTLCQIGPFYFDEQSSQLICNKKFFYIKQLFWHQQGTRAVVELKPVEDRSQAEAMARERGGLQLDWITL